MTRATATHAPCLDPERLLFPSLAIALAITPLTLHVSYKELLWFGDVLIRYNIVAEEKIVPYAGPLFLSLCVTKTILYSRLIMCFLKLPFERLIERVRDCRALEGLPICLRKISAVSFACLLPLLASELLDKLTF